MSFTETNPDDGGVVTVSYTIVSVAGDVVETTETMTGQWWDEPQVGRGPMRFLAPDKLAGFLDHAGFAIAEQYGDWAKGPLAGDSKEIVTVAARRGLCQVVPVGCTRSGSPAPSPVSRSWRRSG